LKPASPEGSLETRITRLEQAQERARNRRVYRMVAAEMQMDVDELQEECEAFLSMSLERQLAEIDRIGAESDAAGIPWPEMDGIKQTLITHYREP
jgi:hypothetical protein